MIWNLKHIQKRGEGKFYKEATVAVARKLLYHLTCVEKTNALSCQSDMSFGPGVLTKDSRSRTYLANNLNSITRDYYPFTSLWMPKESQVESYEN